MQNIFLTEGRAVNATELKPDESVRVCNET